MCSGRIRSVERSCGNLSSAEAAVLAKDCPNGQGGVRGAGGLVVSGKRKMGVWTGGERFVSVMERKRVTEVKGNASPDQTFLRHLQCGQSLLLLGVVSLLRKE